MSSNFRIETPHAAVIVWNYRDRITADDSGNIEPDAVDKRIISTLSCLSIQTSKSKSSPAGSFQLVLAPFKNWISTLTAGSWCAIMMSNEPITKQVIERAHPSYFKMFGKIETVRAETKVTPDGARQTRYYVSGTDWGHIFNNILYVDNNIAAENDPRTQGNSAAVALRNISFKNGSAPIFSSTNDLLSSLIKLFGASLGGLTEAGDDINRLAKSMYDISIPREVASFFNFVAPTPVDFQSQTVNKLLNLKTGALVSKGTYDNKAYSFGYLDPFSLQGSNSFWQILIDNSNAAINEMFPEIEWTSSGRPKLTLFNRIKPFAYRTSNFLSGSGDTPRSKFQMIPYHKIDAVTVTSINAGTNWRDKFNFIEIKPQFQDFNIIANWTKQKTQNSDQDAFEREGFRPMIVGVKQFPADDKASTPKFDPAKLEGWSSLLREWYFDTHRLLNGTITMTGTTEYIAVGNNIRFDAGLINITPNMNSSSNRSKQNPFILAHIESVSHSFQIREDGAREYATTIQFVRGITVQSNGALVGEGSLDHYADRMTPTDNRNQLNSVSHSEDDDPDPEHVKA